MANTLRFKRGIASGIPTALAGEPLFTTDTFDLYIGNGTTNTRFQKYIASGATTQILRGDGSLYTFPLAISSPSNGQVLKYNGTSWVNDSDAGITGSGTAGQVAYFTGATTQGGSNNLFWDNTNGRLGVGTNNPAYTFHTISSASTIGAFRNSAAALGQLLVGNTAADLQLRILASGDALIFSDSGKYMALGSNGAERARIFANGNFGIGTGATDSGEKLQVTGTMKVTGASNFGGNITSSLNIISNNGTVDNRLSWSSTPAGVVGTISNHPLEFYTNGGVKMLLSASGNLGLGVTPSAWSAGKAIEVAALGNSIWGAGGGDISILSNAYYQTNFKYASANLALGYRLQDGVHKWLIAPLGSAGGNITFTQAMTLDASGNLGVGTAIPSNRLHISAAAGSSHARWTEGSTTIGFVGGANGIISGITGYMAVRAESGLILSGQANAINLSIHPTTGNIIINNGTTDSGERLQVNGTAKVTGDATFSSSVTAASGIITGNLTVDTNTLFVDATNNRVGIGTAYPSDTLQIAGNIYAIKSGGSKLRLADQNNEVSIESSPSGSTSNLIFKTEGTIKATLLGNGDFGLNITPSYKLDVSGSARVSDAIAIGTTPDTNNPFKILKNINSTVGIKFENTNTSSSAFSAVQLGTDISGGTKFTNLVYASSGISSSGVYNPDGTSLINNGSGGLNFLGNPIRMYTGGSNGVLRWDLVNDGYITHYSATAPTTSAADSYRQYSADVTAGNAAPHFRTENGAVIKLYQETTAVGNAIFSAGGGNSVLDDSTFDGYTLRQIVKALRNQGILA